MTNIYANVGKTGNLARSLLLIYPKIARFYRFLYPLENAKSLEHNPLPKLGQPEKSAKICQNLHREQILAAGPRPSVSYDPSILRVRLPHSLFLSDPCTTHHTPSTPSPSALCQLHILSGLRVRLPHSLFLSEPYTIHLTPSTLFPFVEKSPALLTRVTGKMRRNQPRPNRTKSIVFAKKPLPDFSINSAATDNCRNRESSFFRTFSQKCEKLTAISSDVEMNEIDRIPGNPNAGLHHPHGSMEFLRPLPPDTPKTRKRTAGGVLLQHHLTLHSANSILKNTLSGNISKLREGQGTS